MSNRDPWDEWRRRRQGGFFGDFFPREIEQELERMRHDMERMMSNFLRGSSLPEPGQPFVYGFSLQMGPDGKPQFQEFGNARPFSPEAGTNVRAPLVDIQNGDEQIAVTVELPGVEKEDINLHVAEDRLTLRVDTGRRYYKEIPLPARVVPGSANATFKNGVLDVTLERQDSDTPQGERVPIK